MDRIDPMLMRAPNDLAVTDIHLRRVLIVGSCLSERWASWISSLPAPCESDVYLLGTELPDEPVRPITEYDFQIIQLALRFVVPDGSFARLSQRDATGHDELFAHALNATRQQLAASMRWNEEHGIMTFVFPYITPVQNAIGRMLPRYDFRNPVYFVERLNEALCRELDAYQNVFWLDLNEIHSFFGRRFVQEDVFMPFNHGSYISDFDFEHDKDRLEPAGRATELIEEQLWSVFQAAWAELLAMLRSARQSDNVKMVIVDLDDTLWRGVAAELDGEDLPTSEGWPKGLWEALLILKRRGILLGIISKNEESRILDVWHQVFRKYLTIEDFAVHRINWRSKTENMSEILEAVGLSSKHVVYVDDNPVERSAIKASFPEIRVLTGQPLTWRRILLWSPETQADGITTEATDRTMMVQSQLVRQEQRRTMPRSEFLRSLGMKVRLLEITSTLHPRFPRVLELINRTNQFNTTGLRWLRQDCMAAFAKGLKFIAFEAEDKFTEYGLVGTAILDDLGIFQFIMSCRVIGLDLEAAVVAALVEKFRVKGAESIEAEMKYNERNLPCQNLYEKLGFQVIDGKWQRRTSPPLAIPGHIKWLGPFPSFWENASFTDGETQKGDSSSSAPHDTAGLSSYESRVEPFVTTQEPGAAFSPQRKPNVIILDDVTFGRAGNDKPYLVSGWCGAEPQHRWSSGKACELTFAMPSVDNLFLMIDVFPRPGLPPNKPSQRALVYAQGIFIKTLTIRQAGRQGIRLPPIGNLEQKVLRIRIELPDAAIGKELGLSTDTRCLGLCFKRVRLVALSYDSSQPPVGQAGALLRSVNPNDFLRTDEILSHFYSLGESRDFGEIQSRAGLKSLGLLGSSGLPLRALLEAIDHSFDGLGEPESLDSLSTTPDGQVTAAIDRNYNIAYRENRPGKATSAKDWKARLGGGMKALRDKMLADLEDANQTFVFHLRPGSEPLTENDIIPLFVSIRSRGDACLLFLTTADEKHAPGSVEVTLPGLFHGYLPPEGSEKARSAEAWLRVCSSVLGSNARG